MHKKTNKRRNDKEKLENIVMKTIREYDLIKPGDKIVIGVSGGPDSMCLLDNLNMLREKFQFQFPQTNPEPVGNFPKQTRNQWGSS